MKIAYYSDLHIEFKSWNFVKSLLRKTEADVLVVAGDLINSGQTAQYLHRIDDIIQVPLLYVPGNHDFYNISKTEYDKELARHQFSNVHVLNSEMIKIGGIRFVGATGWWTDISKRSLISINDFTRIKDIEENQNGNLWGQRDKTFFSEQLATKHPGKTVCISHHAPSLKCIPRNLRWREFNDCYANNWDSILLKHSPTLWIHGHIHQKSNNFMIGATRVLSNPYGYHSKARINPEFREKCIVEIQ